MTDATEMSEPEIIAGPKPVAKNRWQRVRDSDFTYAFLRSPVAIISAAVVLLLVLSAVFAPWIATSNPFDPSSLPEINKAVLAANIGVTPMNDGRIIRIPVPELSEERRNELVKVAHKYAEQARVAVRHVRRDGMEMTKTEEKDGDISQDELRNLNERVQKLTDEHIAEIDALLAAKESEILQV